MTAAVRAALDTLAEIPRGWIDGQHGETPTAAVIVRGRAVIDAMDLLGNVTDTVFPTEDGGVRFYWPDTDDELTVDVEPSGALYVHTVDVEAATFRDSTIPADVTDLRAALAPWLQAVSHG